MKYLRLDESNYTTPSQRAKEKIQESADGRRHVRLLGGRNRPICRCASETCGIGVVTSRLCVHGIADVPKPGVADGAGVESAYNASAPADGEDPWAAGRGAVGCVLKTVDTLGPTRDLQCALVHACRTSGFSLQGLSGLSVTAWFCWHVPANSIFILKRA